MDLSHQGLGPGKLVVGLDVACQTLEELHRRGRPLLSSQVVVSSEFEVLVKSLVRQCGSRVFGHEAPRINRLKDEEVLDLGMVQSQRRPRDRDASMDDLRAVRQRTERTFIDIDEPRARSDVTHSTTTVHLGVAMNHRTRVPR